jgi:hypothetical protein
MSAIRRRERLWMHNEERTQMMFEAKDFEQRLHMLEGEPPRTAGNPMMRPRVAPSEPAA